MSQVIVPDGSNLHKQKKEHAIQTVQKHREVPFGVQPPPASRALVSGKMLQDLMLTYCMSGVACKERTIHGYQIRTMYLQKVKCSSI